MTRDDHGDPLTPMHPLDCRWVRVALESMNLACVMCDLLAKPGLQRVRVMAFHSDDGWGWYQVPANYEPPFTTVYDLRREW